MDFKKEVGARLKELREQYGYNQKELADLFKSSQSAINRYENGVCEPNLETLVKYGMFFKVSCDWILGRTPRRMEGVRLSDLNEEINEDSPFYKTLETAIFKIMDKRDGIRSEDDEDEGDDN